MSLTSTIKLKEIREVLRERFPRPTIKKSEFPLVVEPKTKNYSIVGMAFDYLFRWIIERNNPQSKVNTWVAEHGANQCSVTNPEIGLDMVSELEIAKNEYNKYLETGILTDDALRSCILLAKMEVIYRAGYVDQNFSNVDLKDIHDLRDLAEIVNIDDFTPQKYCILNPSFGEASALVGGADGDLIIDGMLIDIKVTKNLEIKEGHYHQLIGYAMLSHIGSVRDMPKGEKITSAGIYFARHGVLCPVVSFDNEGTALTHVPWKELKEHSKWFKDSV